MGDSIDYKKLGVPVLRAVFTDFKGKPIWTEGNYQFSRMSSVGDFIVHESKQYVVRRVAVCEGTMYVNFEASHDAG
jgi:hypothetical protein